MKYIEWIKIANAVVAAGFGFLFGQWDRLLTALVALIAVDYISGVLGAVYAGKLSSAVGAKGIIKKAGILLLVALAHIMGKTMGLPEIRALVIGFYIANEGISILENWGELGLPLPQQLKDAVSRLHDENQ